MTSNAIYTIDNLLNRYIFFEKPVTIRVFMYCYAENYLETFYGRPCSLAEECDGHLMLNEVGTLVGVSYDSHADIAEMSLRQKDKSVRVVKVPHIQDAQLENSRAYRVMQFDSWTSISR